MRGPLLYLIIIIFMEIQTADSIFFLFNNEKYYLKKSGILAVIRHSFLYRLHLITSCTLAREQWWRCIQFWSNLQSKTLCPACLSWKISHDIGFLLLSHCKYIFSVPEQISRLRRNAIINRQQTHFHIHRLSCWRGPQGSSGQTFLVKTLSIQHIYIYSIPEQHPVQVTL